MIEKELSKFYLVQGYEENIGAAISVGLPDFSHWPFRSRPRAFRARVGRVLGSRNPPSQIPPKKLEFATPG